MSVGGGSSFVEKLEHSTVLDLLSIAVYIYFGWVAYINLDFNQDDILTTSTDPTVLAVQLAGLLVAINIIFLLHDRFSGSSTGIH